MLHRMYTTFCKASVENAFGGAELGAKGANAGTRVSGHR